MRSLRHILSCKISLIVPRLILVVLLTVVSGLAYAEGQINLLKRGWLSDDLDIVYCNTEAAEATVLAKTSGRFLGEDKVVIGSKKCSSFTFTTSEVLTIFHVRTGDNLKVISFEKKSTNILSGEAFRNFVFLLLGAALVGIQDFLKYLFVGPVTALKLSLLYRENVRAFKRAKDDIGKEFKLSDALMELDTKPTADTAFVTTRLAARIRSLADLYKDWRSERPLSMETREKINNL